MRSNNEQKYLDLQLKLTGDRTDTEIFSVTITILFLTYIRQKLFQQENLS